MKKIAIPTVNDRIISHFGHAQEFTIYSIENNQFKSLEKVLAEQGCGCRSNIIEILRKKGVTILLAGNMGEGAYLKLQHAGMEVIRGCNGKSEKIISDYISGKLADSGDLCLSHGTHLH